MRQPRLLRDRLTLEVLKADDLADLVSHVDGAISWANQSYETHVLPRERREAEGRTNDARGRQDDLDKARDIAKEL
jgi:hypothetical protein